MRWAGTALAVLCAVACAWAKPDARHASDTHRPDGITVGHRVKRGQDWSWGDQDGGPGGQGVVIELRRWRGESDPYKFGVRVKWDTGKVNTYRWGVQDKYDVEIIGFKKVPEEDLVDSTPKSFNCDPVEKRALLRLYEHTDGPNWRAKKGWTASTDPCLDSWDGVVCEGSHVKSINLNSNGLRGAIPPTVLSSFSALKALTLSHNRLSGSIPFDLFRCAELRWMSLHDNEFTGTLPETFAGLRSLEWLSVYNNQLHGTIPAYLGHLTRLTHLFLNANSFEGTVPESFAQLAQLEELHLQQNANLHGSVPSALVDSAALRTLRLPPTVRGW